MCCCQDVSMINYSPPAPIHQTMSWNKQINFEKLFYKKQYTLKDAKPIFTYLFHKKAESSMEIQITLPSSLQEFFLQNSTVRIHRLATNLSSGGFLYYFYQRDNKLLQCHSHRHTETQANALEIVLRYSLRFSKLIDIHVQGCRCLLQGLVCDNHYSLQPILKKKTLERFYIKILIHLMPNLFQNMIFAQI